MVDTYLIRFEPCACILFDSFMDYRLRPLAKRRRHRIRNNKLVISFEALNKHSIYQLYSEEKRPLEKKTHSP